LNVILKPPFASICAFPEVLQDCVSLPSTWEVKPHEFSDVTIGSGFG
jgi:hypothetical protein